MFFSSHILADAEALCSRVAVVAGGRLAASGRLSDLLAFQLRGWEMVVAGVTPEMLAGIARACGEGHGDFGRTLHVRGSAGSAA